MILIDLLGIALFTNWLLWWFSPLEPLRTAIIDRVVRWGTKYNIWWPQTLLPYLFCVKCTAFWGTLIWSANLSYALITSFLAIIIKYILEYVESESN